MELRRQRLQRRLPQRLGLLPGFCLVGTETEPLKPPDEFALDGHFTLVVYLGQKGLLLFEPAQQYGCAPVHKSLRQPRVKRIRQAVFYRASLAAPMVFVINPALSLRDICPRPNKGQTFGQCVNVAICPVNPPNLPRQPVVGHLPVFVQIAENPLNQRRMFGMADPPKIRHAAHIP